MRLVESCATGHDAVQLTRAFPVVLVLT